jgi:hypothetical protein
MCFCPLYDKNSRMKYCLIFFALICVTVSCKKEANRDPVPSITFTGISDTVIAAGSSSFIHVRFNFTDGDADLGVDAASGEFDIYTIDSRDAAEVGYYFPFELPDLRQEDKPMTGSCVLSLEGAFIALRPDHPTRDTVRYEVYIKDRAGNESNHITTPPIYIVL